MRSSGRARTRSANDGDPPLRDRDGNWTYGFAVVVDDLRQGVDLVIRGRDLLSETAAQIRLGACSAARRPPSFAHHPLIRRPDGRKLSKADGDTSVRDLRAAGRTAAELIGEAAGGGRVDRRPPAVPARGRGGRPIGRRACSTAAERDLAMPSGRVGGPPSPRRGRGRARRSGAPRSGRSTSVRRAASRRTAGAGSSSIVGAHRLDRRAVRRVGPLPADPDLAGVGRVGLDDVADHLVAVAAAAARALAQLGGRARGDPVEDGPGRLDEARLALGLRRRPRAGGPGP